jgi:hypothetical protein
MRRPEPEITMSNMWKEPITRTDQSTQTSRSRGSLRTSTSTKGVTLRKLQFAIVTALFVVAALAGSVSAGSAASTKIVKFTATYAGVANVTVADGVSSIKATGPGKGLPIGAGRVTGVGTGSADESQACQLFNGTGTITGTKGARVNFKMTSAQACGDAEGESFSIVGRATVTGGAGAFKKAKGSLKVTGIYTKSAKSFSIKFNGKLTV